MGTNHHRGTLKMEEGDVTAETEIKTEITPETDQPEEDVAPAGFDLDEAIKQTLKKALYTRTLYRGLREACRILDSRQALFCILAKSCDHADYVKEVEAHRVVGASVVVVPQNIAKENAPAVTWLV